MLEPIYEKDDLEKGIIEALRHIEAFDDLDKAKECLRLALSPNEKWAINLLNSSKSDNMKFHTMNNYQLPYFKRVSKTVEKPENSRLCVVYQVWGNHNYLSFLYLSILSQLAYTDMLDYDVKIFLGKGFVNDVGASVLERFLPEGSIIPVSDGLSLKYGLTTHPHLQNYDVVCVIDTDAFWYNPSGKKSNVYSKILDLYDNGMDGLIMAPDPDPADDVFWQRRDTLNYNIPEIHYKEYFERNGKTDINRLDDFLKNDKWFLSCLFIYGKKHFKEPGYAQYAITCLYDELLCDETVWMMWGMGHDYKITDMNDTEPLNWIGPQEFDSFWKRKTIKDDTLYYIHPVQGNHCYNMRIQELYDEISEDYLKNSTDAS